MTLERHRHLPNVVNAPDEIDTSSPSIMLAGGISDWRTSMIDLLSSFPGTLLNPMRKQWPQDDVELQSQLVWERQALRLATLRLFWFHSQSDCPNTMLELGYTLRADQRFVVGVDPNYSQRKNVMMYLNLDHPELAIANTLEQLAEQALDFFEGAEA